MDNYFTFYNIPVTLDIDKKYLRTLFLEKSRAHHPDLHGQASDELQDESIAISALNNKAFNTLKDDEKRIEHILKISGRLDGSEKMSPVFLMEMMNINEDLMEGKMGDIEKAKNASAAISALQEGLQSELLELSESFQSNAEEDLDRLLDIFLQQRYLKRLLDQLDDKVLL